MASKIHFPVSSTEMDELVRASSRLSREPSFKSLVSVLVEQSIDISGSDLAVLYLVDDPEAIRSDLRMIYRRGRYLVAERISQNSDLVDFMRDCDEAVILLDRKKSPFIDILLTDDMKSGIALPISIPNASLGILILNSRQAFFYDRKRFHFLDSFTRVASGMLHNMKLYQEMQDYLRKIEQLERYQESIFSSMTNLLITTDREGKIQYFNTAAEERMGLEKSHVALPLEEVLHKGVDRKILRAVEKTGKEGGELLGVKGIYSSEKGDMDFTLNVSPLRGKRGRNEGQTFLFTDQSRERELQEKMEGVIEERRMIKDMFSLYLSKEIVQKLMDTPETLRPGGDKKLATIFFADIRGYTSFSERRDPEEIIQILNEYFSEAVEVVLEHRGYIDKFIGDCIMAAWGVPLQTEEEDAISAVSCALEIQKRVSSPERTFFTGPASHLKVGIGVHTGPLVAGNLGGMKRMNYTVIGDTVNVAARLEGVAGAGEIIITQDTRDYLGDRFVLTKKRPVSVKGKAQPIRIYSVTKKAS